MSDQAVLSVRVLADTGNAVPQILRVETQLQGADAQAKRTAETLGGPLAQASQRAATSSLALAQAEARLLAASGDLDGAQQRVRSALIGTEVALTRQYSAQRQLLGLQQQAERQTAQGAAAIQRQANEALALAQIEARLLATTGDLAGAERRLETALDGSTAALRQQIAAQAQLAAVRRRQAAEVPAPPQSASDGLTGALSGIQGGLAAVGIGLGVEAVVGYGLEAGKAALSVMDLDQAIRLTVKDQAQYSEALALAANNQRLFGGSTAENLEPIRQLIGVSRAFGAELTDLNTTATLLATKNPFEGFEGGAFALNEFLSGDTASLKERFNLKGAALLDIKNSGAPVAEQLRQINALLAEQGIRMAAVEQRATGTAQTYRELGVALSNLQTNIGTALAKGGEGTAKSMTDILNVGGDNKSLTDAIVGLQALHRQMTGLPPLTAAQTAQTRAFTASLVESRQAAVDWAVGMEHGRRLLVGMPAMTAAQEQSFRATGEAVLGLAQAEQQAAQAHVQSAGATQISTAAALQNAPAVVQQSVAAANYATIARDAAMAAQEAAGASALDTAQKDLNSLALQQVQLQANALLSEYLALNPNISASAGAAQAAAAGYSPAIQQLIAFAIQARQLRAEIQAARAEAALAGVKTLRAGNDGLVDDIQTTKRDTRVAQTNALIASQRAATAAQRDLATAQGNYQPQIDQYNRDLAAINARLAGLTPGTIAYNDALAEQARTQQKLNQAESAAERSAKKGGGGGGGASPKLTDQQKLNNQLLTDQEKYEDKAQDAYEGHQRKLADIAKEYADKRRQAAEDAHLAELGSQASFYRRTGDLQDQAIREQASREYEQARQDAAKLAPDVQDDYLKEREQQIAARAERAQEIADKEREAREAGSKAARDQAASRAEYLRGVDQLERQLEDERLRRIQENRDTLAAQEEAARSAETDRYTQQQDQLAEQAGRSADRRILAAQRAGKAVDDERAAVEALSQSYAQLPGATSPSAVPSTTAATPPSATTAPTTSASTSLDTVAGLLRELIDAVRSSGREIVGAERDTAGRIGALASQLR